MCRWVSIESSTISPAGGKASISAAASYAVGANTMQPSAQVNSLVRRDGSRRKATSRLDPDVSTDFVNVRFLH